MEAGTQATPRAAPGVPSLGVARRRVGEVVIKAILLVYAKQESLGKPEVEAFVRYALENQSEVAEASQFVPLTDEQLEQAQTALRAAVEPEG